MLLKCILCCTIYFVECDECELVDSMCFKHERYCMIIFCGQNNWFAGRKLCQKHGYDLAILHNTKEAIDKVALSIEQRKNPCINFWIGMSTFSWRGRNGELYTSAISFQYNMVILLHFI